MRDRAEVIYRLLRNRLDTVLPVAMREAGIDCWVILCQEDDLDPVFTTMIPMDTWCPILQVLVFFDRGDAGIERFNLSGTGTGELYARPYAGQLEREQWPMLTRLIEERDPRRIGINTGSVAWAAGGLTVNLHRQLVSHLAPRFAGRLVSAEAASVRWLATLTRDDLAMFEHVVQVGHALIAECYSQAVIVPGVTTTNDLTWHYWQRCADLGVEPSFKPYFGITRSTASAAVHGDADQVIRAGDLLRCDVGIRYLRFNSDHQQCAYVLRPGETEAPAGLRTLMDHCTRLQDIYLGEFHEGRTGNEMLKAMLDRARRDGVPGAKVYSHSLGLFLHEPGPLIGLPWEQGCCPGRGDVTLRDQYAFTMELGVGGAVPEWGGQEIRLGREEDVAFVDGACRPIDGRQTELFLV
jgi:hypothetical protein